MVVDLIVEPGAVKTWEQFCIENPPYSIALDGYVIGAPRFDEAGPRLNLNHHEGVDRLSTRSTSGQAYVAIKQNLFHRFNQGGEPIAHLYVNDTDEDTSLAVWLLKNHERISRGKSEPRVNKLVHIEDMLDTTAGAYQLNPYSEIMNEISWIFQPHIAVRMSGNKENMAPKELEKIIDAISERIEKYVAGTSEKIETDARYELYYKGDGWAMIREIGPHARTKLFNDGIFAFVSIINGKNGKYKYTIGKMSPFIPFPIVRLYEDLNHTEKIHSENMDRWSGGNIIGGSPRISGSKLSPDELSKVISSFLK